MGVSRIRELFRSFFIKQMKSLLPSHPPTYPPTPYPSWLGKCLQAGRSPFSPQAGFTSGLESLTVPTSTQGLCCYLALSGSAFTGLLAGIPSRDRDNQENGSYQFEAALPQGLPDKCLQQTLIAGLWSAGCCTNTFLPPTPTPGIRLCCFLVP